MHSTTFHFYRKVLTEIRENISYGKPDATIAEIIEASKKAFSHEFVEKMGYETLVGERGTHRELLQRDGGKYRRL